jgi:CO dehydrogenase maturation factor
VDSAYRVFRLARDIGLNNIAVVGNKVRNPEDKDFLVSSLANFTFLGFIPYDQAIVDADLASRSLLDASKPVSQAVADIYQALLAGSATGAR